MTNPQTTYCLARKVYFSARDSTGVYRHRAQAFRIKYALIFTARIFFAPCTNIRGIYVMSTETSLWLCTWKLFLPAMSTKSIQHNKIVQSVCSHRNGHLNIFTRPSHQLIIPKHSLPEPWAVARNIYNPAIKWIRLKFNHVKNVWTHTMIY